MPSNGGARRQTVVGVGGESEGPSFTSRAHDGWAKKGGPSERKNFSKLGR